MTLGSYSTQYDWRKYESPNAHAIFADRYTRMYCPKFSTCGTPLLSLLTGLSTSYIDKRKATKYWWDSSLIKFLKSRKYKVVSLTKRAVTNLDPEGANWLKMPINENHVLICNSLVCKSEASWWIVHAGYLWHNWDVWQLDPLFFVNKPSQNIYLVFHKSWG